MSQLPANIATALTSEEENFVYNVEVLDLPVKKAAQLAGLPVGSMNKPHIMQARELLRRELRGDLNVTREDVLFGYKDAINRAKILGAPETEIMGWEKISKLMGFDAPQKVDINVRESIQVVQQHVRSLPDDELAKFIGAQDIIDADFYEVKKD